MNISSTIKSAFLSNEIVVVTNGNAQEVSIATKPSGYGSSVNGGELLFLALATCFCNDVYREAAKRKMTIEAVEVIVSGEFGSEGEPARKISYEVIVKAPRHEEEEIAELIRFVDTVAEIHNTLRQGVPVTLKNR